MFQDHFSHAASEYASFRPVYPRHFIAFVASLPRGRRLAWDCGTGSGQAATLLAEHFDRVVATDAAEKQIARASPHERVEYRVALAHESGLPPASCDLVSVAQALHWFDLDLFYHEVDRVLVPGGALAVWCYGNARVSPAIDVVVDWFYATRVGRFWPRERRLVEEAYSTLPFPYPKIPPPQAQLQATMTRQAFVGYVGTWSAVSEARRIEKSDPLPDLERELDEVWPTAAPAREVTWPLALHAGLKPQPSRASEARPG